MSGLAPFDAERDQDEAYEDRGIDRRGQDGDRRGQSGDRRDQGAETRDEAGGQRDVAGAERDVAGAERDSAADNRDQAANQRDQAGKVRDKAASHRDQAADDRDQAAEQFEGSAGAGITTDSRNRSARARREAAFDRTRASHDRRAGATERDQAQLDRDTAIADRRAGAVERSQAEVDRDMALADRSASASERIVASVDGLTGVYLRRAGIAELARDLARARRSEQPLTVAFVDVDRLKSINSLRGYAAGDRLLLEVAQALRDKLRSYDLIIRYGGDEFVCAISGLNLADATKRLGLVNAALAEAPGHGSVTVGLAELQPDDSLEDLVARAEADLDQARQEQRHVPSARTPGDVPVTA
jgi:diguanylate cyclase (GGDEF)-like protein